MSAAIADKKKEKSTLKFTGHDTFECRLFWLKKGYDYVKKNGNFNAADAVIHLGVGKNMVSSIRFWLKAFNITNEEDEITEFGKLLFDEEVGLDPFLQDDASLWLLHYQLVTHKYASIYAIIFNELRKARFIFDEDIFVNFVVNKYEQFSSVAPDNIKKRTTNANALKKDFNVFAKLYDYANSNDALLEDSLSSVFSELELVSKIEGKRFQIENLERPDLPFEVVLYAILISKKVDEESISFDQIENAINSPGLTFALNRKGLLDKIEEITKKYPKSIIFSDQAGIKELQFKKKFIPNNILKAYYGK